MSELIEVMLERHIAQVALNRPAAYNAFNYEMVSRLGDHLAALAGDENVRAVVISGRGKAFCAGGDLKWVLGNATRPAAAFHRLAAQFHLAILEIRRMRKPVLAAINGVAAGGGFSLALACDFRIMEKSAVLKQAYTSSGLCIDGGGTFTLPRLVGYARALEIAAFDEPISSDQASAWGLVTKVVEDGQALTEATKTAQQLTLKSLHSFAWCKKLITDSFNTSFETQIERERAALEACADHPDGLEGLKAFSEKRKPNYSAR
ncbi:MAG: enoyl-CoA hydratase/isomerase family protein [Desulfobacterales bacterium]|nr:MAG: enoyl-CoA hydratase/isomerase family protein [Desulfobacterales bacterium]